MKKLVLSLAAMALASSASVSAAAVDEEYLKSFEFDVKLQTLETVKEQVTQTAVVEKYKLSMPILPPRLSPEQVAALVDQEVEAMVEAEHPKSYFKQIEVDARERYRMYQINDLITVRVLDRRANQKVTITRSLRSKNDRGVYLGDEFFIYQDIISSEYPHFFQKQHDEAVNRYIIGRSKVYKITRQNYEKKVRKRLTRVIWRVEGYVFRKKKGKWVPREEVFNYLFQKNLLAAFKKVRPDVEALVYDQKAGLKWNEELQEWFRPGEEPVTDPLTGGETVTSVNEVKESLKDWTKDIETLFSEGKGDDIWGEDETGGNGDAEDEGDKAEDKKDEKPEKEAEPKETEE